MGGEGKVFELNIWEGDKIFFRLMNEDHPFFSLKLVYDETDTLLMAALDGREMELFDILNEDGSKSGIVTERGVAHLEGSLHPTAHVWIIRKNEQSGYDLLLQKEVPVRTPTRDVMMFHQRGMWKQEMIISRQLCGN